VFFCKFFISDTFWQVFYKSRQQIFHHVLNGTVQAFLTAHKDLTEIIAFNCIVEVVFFTVCVFFLLIRVLIVLPIDKTREEDTQRSAGYCVRFQSFRPAYKVFKTSVLCSPVAEFIDSVWELKPTLKWV
jgi:hypothetical protein